jgi:GntR family transcriptional regulator
MAGRRMREAGPGDPVGRPVKASRRGELASTLPSSLSFRRPKGAELQEILESVLATLPPGALLPSERGLARRYGVARATVSQAVDALAAKGLVYRVHGSGTFVAEPKFLQPETLTSFTEDMRARGMGPGSLVLAQEVVPASALVARHLELVAGAPVVFVHRVRTADGEPMAVERTYLPSNRFPGLHEVDLAGRSLYDTLAATWGVRVAVADQWVSVVRLAPDDAVTLGVAAAVPALLFQRVTREAGGAIVEYVRALYRGDRYEVHTRLERTDPTGA